jgi:hypothetical protein
MKLFFLAMPFLAFDELASIPIIEACRARCSGSLRLTRPVECRGLDTTDLTQAVPH